MLVSRSSSEQPCNGHQIHVRRSRKLVDNLMKQSAAEGNQVATQQLGAAPAPQLAIAVDPVPNTDPAIPMNEYVTPQPGAQNNWSPIVPEDVMEMILEIIEDQDPPEDMMLDQILDGMYKYMMMVSMGGTREKNAKWKFI